MYKYPLGAATCPIICYTIMAYGLISLDDYLCDNTCVNGVINCLQSNNSTYFMIGYFNKIKYL